MGVIISNGETYAGGVPNYANLINYDSTNSKLESTNVQDAIDTLADKVTNNPESSDNITNIIADAYDNNLTYSVGDYCIYDKKLYKCMTEVPIPEEFDTSKWTITTCGDEFGVSTHSSGLNIIDITQEDYDNLPDESKQDAIYHIIDSDEYIKAENVEYNNSNVKVALDSIKTDMGTLQSEIDNKSDSDHTHDNNYYLKSEVDTKLVNKSNTDHNHDDNYYSKSEIDTKLSNIDVDPDHTHTIANVEGLQTALDNKSNTDHTHTVENVEGLQTALDNKSNTDHNHDDNYYLKSEIDDKFDNIDIDPDHTHTIANVEGLQDTLDSKSNTDHTHIIENIDGLQDALDSKSNTDHNHDDKYYTETEIDTKLSSKLDTSLKGSSNGLAELDENGKVLASQLPSYTDDVIEGYLSDGKFYEESTHTTEILAESGKIYIDLSTNKTYRWSGTIFGVISDTIALGETSSTAYRGDRGKTAYDHSQVAHAPSDAEKNQNAFSNVKVGDTTITADTTTDTLTLAGTNVTITPDATNDKVTIGITKDNVTTALGYTPPTTDTTYSVVSTTADGLCPKRGGTTTKYLRDDGTWAVPPDTNTTYSNFVKSGSSAASGLVPAPSTTAGTTKYLREDGTWQVPPNTTYSNFVKSGSSAASGLVPAPSTTAGTTKYLREDGTWQVPPNTTYSNATTSAAGLMSSTDKTNLNSVIKKQFTITGDGSTKAFTFTHSKASYYVMVEVLDSTYQTVYPTVTRTDTNNIKISFSEAPASGTKYYVLVI